MKLLNKCPICGGALFTDTLYQFSYIQKINKSGKINKTKKRTNVGSMECYAIYCENKDFITDYDLEIIEPHEMKDKIIVVIDDKYYLRGLYE